MKELDIVSLALRIVKENHPQMGCWWMCDFVGRRTSLVVVRVHDSDYDRIVAGDGLGHGAYICSNAFVDYKAGRRSGAGREK